MSIFRKIRKILFSFALLFFVLRLVGVIGVWIFGTLSFLLEALSLGLEVVLTMFGVISKKLEFVCPYCFESSKLNDIHFRCNNIDCKELMDDVQMTKYERGDITKPKKEKVWIEFRDKKTKNPKRLSLIPHSVDCPECNKTTTTTICPCCHNPIPKSTMEGRDIVIPVVGTRAAGKTHFLGVLMNELMNEVIVSFDGEMEFLDDESERRYEEIFGRHLYGADPQKIPQTQSSITSIENGAYRPIIFELSFTKRILFKKMKRYYNIVFFDTAGDDLRKLDEMRAVTKYIGKSSGIMFLLDPTKEQNFATEIHEKTAEGDITWRQAISSREIIRRVSELIRESQNITGKSKPLKVPVAAVLSKLDAFSRADLVDDGSTILEESPHRNSGVFEMADWSNVNTEVIGLLREKGVVSSISGLNKNYKDYSYFAVSALGLDNKVNNDGTFERRPNPHRIEDPFLWILKEKGIIKKKSSKRLEIKRIAKKIANWWRVGLSILQRFLVKIVVVLACLSVIVAGVFGIFANMNNFDNAASNYMIAANLQPDPNNLSGTETVFVNIVVEESGLGWGRQQISYTLQRNSGNHAGEIMEQGYVEVFLGYRFWGNRRVELFTYDFTFPNSYILRLYINDSPIMIRFNGTALQQVVLHGQRR